MTPEDVLRFWLGNPGDPPLTNAKRWWKKDAAFDAEIRERFGRALEEASAGGLAAWRTSARGRLALVIVLDQFSRNVFRGTARAFAQDRLARALVIETLERGDDRSLAIVEREFLLMPLVHAEDGGDQQRALTEFARLRDEAPPELRDHIGEALGYAKLHADIVARFGRFPHRNSILDRTNTGEEAVFLTEPGSSF
jgi:uncharacterized protein (DUF924 family)